MRLLNELAELTKSAGKSAIKFLIGATMILTVVLGALELAELYAYRDALKSGQCAINKELDKLVKPTAMIIRVDEVGDKVYKLSINVPVPMFRGDPINEDTPRFWVGVRVLDKSYVNSYAEVVPCPKEEVIEQ